VRAQSLHLARTLSDADATVQSMPDASPAKWHLAHTTWFFETFVLGPHAPGYTPADSAWHYLFNSYYEALGPRHERPRRGLLTRPTLNEVVAWRAQVDAAVSSLLAAAPPPAVVDLVELGCQHEEQHQELLLTDVLHLFACNPLEPACFPARPELPHAAAAPPSAMLSVPGGIYAFGHSGPGFAFDCEGPSHERLLESFRIAAAPVTNREWRAFMADGGYTDPRWWLSDGWATCRREDWAAPLYWRERDGDWTVFTLTGRRPVEWDAPVCHVSFYEADAYARWAGKRLPTEFEWEAAFATEPVAGHFADSEAFRPQPASGAASASPAQVYGDVWEWTASPFTPYPRFRSAEGALGEYNGKFMANQFVLRGGSCASPAEHLRATYRNFFPPEARWQFSGLRLAEDV